GRRVRLGPADRRRRVSMAIRAGRIVKQRPEWQFFTVLPRADRRLTALWWAVLVARGILPAGFAIATGILVAAVQAHASLAGPLVELIGGLASAVLLAGFRWWAPIVLGGAWLSTHWLLRESGVWKDRRTDEVRAAQRDSDYAYRLAVDPPAAKELRLFGLAGWTIDRFVRCRTHLHQLQYHATRLREKPLAWCMLLVAGANVAVLWALAGAATAGRL